MAKKTSVKKTKKTDSFLHKPLSTSTLLFIFLICVGLIVTILAVNNRSSLDTRSSAAGQNQYSWQSGGTPTLSQQRIMCRAACYEAYKDEYGQPITGPARTQCLDDCNTVFKKADAPRPTMTPKTNYYR